MPGFQIVDGSGRNGGRAVSPNPELSYFATSAQFRLTPAALELLGNPETVEIRYDKEANKLALLASTASHAVKLRKDTPDAKTRYFSFRALAALVGLPETGRSVVPLTWDAEGGYLVGDIPTAATDADESEAVNDDGAVTPEV